LAYSISNSTHAKLLPSNSVFVLEVCLTSDLERRLTGGVPTGKVLVGMHLSLLMSCSGVRSVKSVLSFFASALRAWVKLMYRVDLERRKAYKTHTN
jgi:hypothetical protein